MNLNWTLALTSILYDWIAKLSPEINIHFVDDNASEHSDSATTWRRGREGVRGRGSERTRKTRGEPFRQFIFTLSLQNNTYRSNEQQATVLVPKKRVYRPTSQAKFFA
jgi:hypothetical protein